MERYVFGGPQNPDQTRTHAKEIRGYYPDLRPEDASKEDYSNPYIQGTPGEAPDPWAPTGLF